jgi:flagellar biosynthetic protein FliR
METGFLAELSQRTLWIALLVFARSAGLLRMMPVIGGRGVPRTIRLIESLVLSAVIFPSLWFVEIALPASAVEKLLVLVGEFLIGLAVGAVPAILFSALLVCGGVVGRIGGFSAAAVFDPELGGESGALETLLHLTAIAVFLAVGGLEKFFAAVLSLYDTLPPGTLFSVESLSDGLVKLLSQATTLGVQMALPSLAALGSLWIASAFLGRVLPRLHFLTMTMTFSGNLLAVLFVLNATLGTMILFFQSRLPDWNTFLPTLFTPR